MPSQIPKTVMLRLARGQRELPSNAEKLLWKVIRDRRINVKFRRQMPIGNFIVDFVCLEKRLIIEVDGPHHNDPQQKIADRERELWLRQQAFRILRLTSDEIVGDPELATQKIIAALKLQVLKREVLKREV